MELLERDYNAPDNEELVTVLEDLQNLSGRKSIVKTKPPINRNDPSVLPLNKGGKTAGRSKRRRLSKILNELDTRPSKPWQNKDKTLPTHSKGKKITYREYDYDPPPSASQRRNGADRGKRRVVVGSDGSAYYTNDHY